MTLSAQGMTRDADLTAVWLPQEQADEGLGARIRRAAGGGKPIRGRGIETDGEDLVLIPTLPGRRSRFSGAKTLGRGDAEVVPYWMRYPTDVAQKERLDQAPYLFSVRVFASPQWQQPIRDWLDQEHFERQRAMDGVFYSEGYEPLEGPFHFFNLWAIAHPDLIDSPEWIRVRDSAWFEAVRPGFQASVVLRKIYRILEPDS